MFPELLNGWTNVTYVTLVDVPHHFLLCSLTTPLFEGGESHSQLGTPHTTLRSDKHHLVRLLADKIDPSIHNHVFTISTTMEEAKTPPETGLLGFPQSPSQFDSDPRISFSKLEDKWILETDEGTEYEYVHGLKRWVTVVGTKP